jgi:hypothetical protein
MLEAAGDDKTGEGFIQRVDSLRPMPVQAFNTHQHFTQCQRTAGFF